MKKDQKTIVMSSFVAVAILAGAMSWQFIANRRIQARRDYVQKLALELGSHDINGQQTKLSLGTQRTAPQNEWDARVWGSVTTLRFENSQFTRDRANDHYEKYF